MATSHYLTLLLLMTCVSVSLQKCFSEVCGHDETLLSNCIHGTWECQADEYCEIATHTRHSSHSHSPYHIMDCRPADTITDCLATYAGNDPACDPDKHALDCHWCCYDEACTQGLAAGNYVAPAPVTSAGGTAATTASPAATAATSPGPAATAPPTGTTAPAASGCSDVYLGDCAADFNGRCNEVLVQELCSKTCAVGTCAP